MSFYVRSSTYILLHHASPTTSISPRCSPAVVSSPDCASDVCCAWGPCILKGEPPLEQHGQMGHGAWCWGDIWYFWLGQVAKSKWSPDGCASGLFMSVSPGKKGRPAEWRTPGPWRITDHFLTKHVNFTESSKSRFRPIAIWLKKKRRYVEMEWLANSQFSLCTLLPSRQWHRVLSGPDDKSSNMFHLPFQMSPGDVSIPEVQYMLRNCLLSSWKATWLHCVLAMAGKLTAWRNLLVLPTSCVFQLQGSDSKQQHSSVNL